MRSGAQRRTTSVEDYVKAIYTSQEWRRQPVTTSALAAWFGVSAPSVSDMVRRLATRGLVEHAPYKPIRLTGAGRALAMRMVRRHRLIETYLMGELGYSWDEVHDEAEQLEHVVSDRFLDRIAERLGEPAHDPHGDPIPTSGGQVALPEAVPLAGLAAGEHGRVVRVSDADPAVLRSLSEQGLGLGTRVHVVDNPAHHEGWGADRHQADTAALRVEVDAVGADRPAGPADPPRLANLDRVLATAVWVEPLDPVI